MLRFLCVFVLALACGRHPVIGESCADEFARSPCPSPSNCGVAVCYESVVYDCEGTDQIWRFQRTCDAGCSSPNDPPTATGEMPICRAP